MDNCQYCTVRGDLAKCLATKCGWHDLWIVTGLQDDLNAMTQERDALRREVDLKNRMIVKLINHTTISCSFCPIESKSCNGSEDGGCMGRILTWAKQQAAQAEQAGKDGAE